MNKFLLLLTICFAFTSCKDADDDGIYDRDDGCPETYGLEEFNGCPDTDEDGIKDSEDECPDEYGLEEFNGCPDSDEDGIIDSVDDCPDTYGLEELNGCPETETRDEDLRLTASDCFQAISLSRAEIKEVLGLFNMKSDDLISFESCEIISDYIFDYREIKRGQTRSQSQIDGGDIQTVYNAGARGQYLIVLKGGVYFLMEVIAGGECTKGTMKFNESNYNLQDVWVRESPYAEEYKGFKMRILDKNRNYANLEIQMRKMVY